MGGGMPILVVEDDPALREALCDTLELAGHAVLGAAGAEEALRLLAARDVSLVVSDVRMLPVDGIALLKEIRQRFAFLPVVLMTAFADVDRAVEAMRAGACDFLLKPFDAQVLLAHVLRYRLPGTVTSDGVIATDPVSMHLFALAARVAQTDATVLLTGESGVGKEVVARYIHQHSARRGGPFVAINCAAIPESLLEATLFGHEKGAFSGAQNAQPGKFEQAQGGTLLLDEITEMQPALQAKLLRVLQEREVERVGGRKPIVLDIRVIATTNRDMSDAVARGAFREDLYYRLNVFPLPIPALRQRVRDVVPLARHFLVAHGSRGGRPGLRFSAAAESALEAHPWPGNVRELENVIQRAVILAAGELVEAADLQLAGSSHSGVASEPAPSPGSLSVAGRRTPRAGQSDELREVEREHILETLAAVGGSRKLAGQRLGMPERTLRHKLRQYRIEGFLKG
ncbi:sigma-54 dependent transcriptional regulator [Accumulibacter sp.]|uniref:sigma-54-dependent transcriptional regulator n=1 Tax=Accumulibacter sp. TaxID=2053492 RepID=UPI0025E9E413|nr:sigma-54 dependent transcriptional regulator [Accumulibacter sp.]MCM8596262.1 sigma-54 dependent transcriptional regulator [Accumulibacter sp.]MCM8627193.1 sigma-54 dependent transcriptional regulator [Accumulibacter sp.]MDS4050411.1 sigma-54 dependent transcriptional regulator [Accumulibacter sp.]